MFYKKDSGKYKKAFEGVTYKTLVYGDKTSLGEFKLEGEVLFPIIVIPMNKPVI